MDAVELPYPVDVAAPMLMRSEGFVRAGVTLTEAEAREPDGVSVLVSPPIDRCSSLLSQKDIKMASESTCSDKIPDTELCRHGSQLPSFRGDEVSEHLYGMTQNCVGQYPRPEMLQRKAAKGSRSGTVCSKRRRLVQAEESLSLARVNDKKDMIDELGSYPKRCTSPESTQLVKQKNNFNKRADRRSFKVPAKVKYDSFSMKAGSLNLSSVAGGNNFLGAYGLKLDNHDITKLMDDPALNDLLDGTYKCSTSVKDKGKKKENNDEDFLHSVRKAFSVLQLSRPVQSQSLADIDNFSNKKMSTSMSSTVSGEKGEFCTTDLSSCNKGSCSKPDTPANPLELPSYQPEDILKRLVLAEPKDLESLLLDAAKSYVSSRNTSDIRPGKNMSRRVSLPPFPWSHTFNGHCRSNVDATKLSTTRGTCQGRWVRIGNVSRPPRIAAVCLANLESLTYDHSLVPSELSSENKVPPSIAVSLPSGEPDRLSYATCSKTSHILQDSGGPVNCQGNAGHCPRLLAAAQTLYDMATLSSKPNSEGMIRWSKKSSQKTMKGRKLKSNEKLIETFATSVPLLASNNPLRSVDPLMSSKKPKLSTIESSKDIDRSNCLRKGPIYWSTPRSSRSSPGKSIKEIAETKNSTAGILKHSCTMPPPGRVLDKACNSHQKVRKLLPMDRNRGRDGLD